MSVSLTTEIFYDIIEVSEKEKGLLFLDTDLSPSELGKQTLKDFLLFIINYTPPTFYKDGRLQCTSNSWRSLGDLYNICRVVYPDLKIIELHKLLLKLESDKEIVSTFCGDIKKRVYHLYSPSWANSYYNDEYNTSFSVIEELKKEMRKK